MNHTFYIKLQEPRVSDRNFTKQLVQSLIAQQIVNARVIEGVFNAFKSLETINATMTKDVVETRINFAHKNGMLHLLKLIDLHNARSDLCQNILKDTLE